MKYAWGGTIHNKLAFKKNKLKYFSESKILNPIIESVILHIIWSQEKTLNVWIIKVKQL